MGKTSKTGRPRAYLGLHALPQAQQKFLRALCGEGASVGSALGAYGTKPATLLAWLGEPAFRREVARLRRRLAARRELEVEAAGAAAAGLLQRAAAGEAVLTGVRHRQALVDAVRLARAAGRAHKPPAGAEDGSPAAAPLAAEGDRAALVEALLK